MAAWHAAQMDKTQDRVLGGSIPSAISDTGTLESAFTPTDPTVATGIISTATFGGAFGHQAKARNISKLHHKLREPARSVHIVQKVQTPLLSTSKVVDTGYIVIYGKQEVNFNNIKMTTITMSEEAALKGW